MAANPKPPCSRGCPSPSHTHGLCTRCHRYEQRLDEPWRPRPWPLTELLDEWVWLREHVRFEDFGPRVGITSKSWARAFERARALGDPRAVRARNDPATIPDPAAGLLHIVETRARKRRERLTRKAAA